MNRNPKGNQRMKRCHDPSVNWIISFLWWIKKLRINPQEGNHAMMVLNEVEWKKGENEPGTGSKWNERIVAVKPQLFRLGMPWPWCSNLLYKVFLLGREGEQHHVHLWWVWRLLLRESIWSHNSRIIVSSQPLSLEWCCVYLA